MTIHRGVVDNNVDPLGLGRLQVRVPTVDRERLTWAMPVLPLGFTDPTTYPQAGDAVWVSFEGDDVNLPVVIGRIPTLPFFTPGQLAAELGHDDGQRPGRRVRHFLRERYPDHPRHKRWQLTPDQADEVRRHFGH